MRNVKVDKELSKVLLEFLNEHSIRRYVSTQKEHMISTIDRLFSLLFLFSSSAYKSKLKKIKDSDSYHATLAKYALKISKDKSLDRSKLGAYSDLLKEYFVVENFIEKNLSS
jgi:hypothetical protein